MILFLAACAINAQVVKLDSIQAIPNTYVDIPVWVDFSEHDVGSLTLFVNYDTSVLEFEEFANVAETMPSLHAMKIEGYNMVMITWVDLGAMSTSSHKGKLMDLVFHYKGGETVLEWNKVYSCLGDAGANYIQGIQFVDGRISELDVTSVIEPENRPLFWPNPATNTLYLDRAQDIEIFDMIGRMVLKDKGNIIDISDLKEGMYLIKTDSSMQRVVKYN